MLVLLRRYRRKNKSIESRLYTNIVTLNIPRYYVPNSCAVTDRYQITERQNLMVIAPVSSLQRAIRSSRPAG
jgi:hypothetical protein